MRDASKRNVLGVLINATDYQKTMDFVFTAARERQGAAIISTFWCLTVNLCVGL